GVVARHEPAADVPAFRVRNVAPAVAAGLPRRRDDSAPPELPARLRIVRRDHARVRAAFGLAAAPGDDLALRDDRPRRLLRAALVVKNLGLPAQLARARVEREDVVVRARVDD